MCKNKKRFLPNFKQQKTDQKRFLTSSLILAGTVANSGDNAYAVRLSTLFMSGLVAAAHDSLLLSDMSPASTWKDKSQKWVCVTVTELKYLRDSSVGDKIQTLMFLTKLAVLLATSFADCTNCLLAAGLLVLADAALHALHRADVCLATDVAAPRTC